MDLKYSRQFHDKLPTLKKSKGFNHNATRGKDSPPRDYPLPAFNRFGRDEQANPLEKHTYPDIYCLQRILSLRLWLECLFGN
jgi:hypothetical protein